jgi:hypothetical protein
MSPTFSINTDITGSELKWVMARLLMGTHFIRAFCPGERFSQTAIGEMMRAAPTGQNDEVDPTMSRRKTATLVVGVSEGETNASKPMTLYHLQC